MASSDLPGHIIKRDGSMEPFDPDKITEALLKAGRHTGEFDTAQAIELTEKTLNLLRTREKPASEATPEKAATPGPEVEEIQDLVEEILLESAHTRTAKAYILYRQDHARQRQRNIFRRRLSLKPWEYPELARYVDSIRHSYWIHTEFNYTSDIQDFKVHVTDCERDVIRKVMLAIAQIEVSVKTFWGDIYKKLPKPEIGSVGYTFAESEVRHHDAYAHLLELLGLNQEFETIHQIPCILGRIRYLEKTNLIAQGGEPRDYTLSILLFSLFIEHVSLFSQFLIIMSFNKYRNLFKGISNVIEATSKEEQIHGLFGIDLIRIIRQEQPQWFDQEMSRTIATLCQEAWCAESEIIDWFFEEGELDFLPKALIREFVKNRFNKSLKSIGEKPLLEVDQLMLQETDWFDDEVITTKHGDFFVKRSINYNKRSRSITGDDLF
ncbi:ribonucleoside-diphosphate reductase beta chain [Alkalispirochaeta americana]|uniref:ribonucleoside-diphosphate reductase n=1 Tax=Alkalispirochaeta americana TaxID=159291 RepID=A0A1N6VZR7_9SPIO|nr:ribonucleotide-diphosphate reductase subunit beta [Alkalispirochaeta americana]SIQ83265.1 ribonucleoside-diphosphate reductase beta chain [Alkalispirochaeta americana]